MGLGLENVSYSTNNSVSSALAEIWVEVLMDLYAAFYAAKL